MPQTKNHRQRTSVHTHSSSRHLKRLPTHPRPQQTRPQWFQENI